MISLSLVIPAYNESGRIQSAIDALIKAPRIRGVKISEVIFVDDGSTDNTKKLLNTAKTQLEQKLRANVQVLSYKANQGKGRAIRKGMLAARGDYAIMMDCDMSTPLSQIALFVPDMRRGTPVIIGTRKNGRSSVVVAQSMMRQLLGRVFTLLSNTILNTWVTDFTCGFKAFDKQSCKAVFSRARINGWGYDSEILFLANRLGYDVSEHAVEWANQAGSKVHILHDAMQSLAELVMIRWNHVRGVYGFRFGIMKRAQLTLAKNNSI